MVGLFVMSKTVKAGNMIIIIKLMNLIFEASRQTTEGHSNCVAGSANETLISKQFENNF